MLLVRYVRKLGSTLRVRSWFLTDLELIVAVICSAIVGFWVTMFVLQIALGLYGWVELAEDAVGLLLSVYSLCEWRAMRRRTVERLEEVAKWN